jgi:hypothetical protein
MGENVRIVRMASVDGVVAPRLTALQCANVMVVEAITEGEDIHAINRATVLGWLVFAQVLYTIGFAGMGAIAAAGILAAWQASR